MSNKIKTIIGVVVIVVVIVLVSTTFLKSKIEYANFNEAKEKDKKVEVKGVWSKDKETKFENNKFTFFMKDDNNTEMKVIFDGAKPNSFETAEMIVVKGKVQGDTFEASSILTKCPSKYETKSKTNQ